MEITDLLEMVINSPVLSAVCVLVVAMASNPDELNGHLKRMSDALEDISKRMGGVEKSQTRMEVQVGTLIERSEEDRSRIGIAEGNIVALLRKQDTIEDRQRGWMGIQAGISAILATIAGVVAAIIGANK